MMQFSYWEHKTWFSEIDFTIVGSGIVGLSTAIFLKKKHPESKILILERGILPQGASTKNAGFACFASLSEIISDLKTHSQEEVYELVKQRFEGIQLLRQLLGDQKIGFQLYGGHEIFQKEDKVLYENCLEQKDTINQLLLPIFGQNPFEDSENIFGFEGIMPKYITHKYEGQLDTGKMMSALLQLVVKSGIKILNTIEVLNFSDSSKDVTVQTNYLEFNTSKLFIATNGFASRFLEDEVIPARAQVLVTKPIKNLGLKGTFHFDEGFYYFRNVANRVLLGGGRNLDFETEKTKEFGQTSRIQNELERLLNEMILPKTSYEIDQRWSGIMGVGLSKKPIIKQLSTNTYCGVRLGGMGVAIGSLVGRQLANLV